MTNKAEGHKVLPYIGRGGFGIVASERLSRVSAMIHLGVSPAGEDLVRYARLPTAETALGDEGGGRPST
jgi:hypothetical protein